MAEDDDDGLVGGGEVGVDVRPDSRGERGAQGAGAEVHLDARAGHLGGGSATSSPSPTHTTTVSVAIVHRILASGLSSIAASSASRDTTTRVDAAGRAVSIAR